MINTTREISNTLFNGYHAELKEVMYFNYIKGLSETFHKLRDETYLELDTEIISTLHGKY